MLTWAVLGARYRAGHLCGAALCIAGLALLVASDSSPRGERRPDGYPAALLGDGLVGPRLPDAPWGTWKRATGSSWGYSARLCRLCRGGATM